MDLKCDAVTRHVNRDLFLISISLALSHAQQRAYLLSRPPCADRSNSTLGNCLNCSIGGGASFCDLKKEQLVKSLASSRLTSPHSPHLTPSALPLPLPSGVCSCLCLFIHKLHPSKDGVFFFSSVFKGFLSRRLYLS